MAIRYMRAKRAVIRRHLKRMGRTYKITRRIISLQRRILSQVSAAASPEDEQREAGKEGSENIAALKAQESMKRVRRLSRKAVKSVVKPIIRYGRASSSVRTEQRVRERPAGAGRPKTEKGLKMQEARKTVIKRAMAKNRIWKRIKNAERMIRKARNILLAFTSAAGALLGITLLVVLLSAAFAFFGNTAAEDSHFQIEELAQMEYESIGDFVAEVALSQVGNDDGALYWEWYGFDEKVDWCACFVSWCWSWAELLEDEETPHFAACDDGIAWFQEQGLWKEPFEVYGEGETQSIVYYYPEPGDVIFFDWDVDGASDHTGIVEKVKAEIIYTIEGNSGGEVREQKYAIGSDVIFGYAILKIVLPMH